MMSIKNSLAIVVLILVINCCNHTSDFDKYTAQTKANKKLVENFAAAINRADWIALDSLITDDFSRHSQASPVEIMTSEAFIALQESFYASTPDQKIKFEMLVAEGDFVATYATYTGTQTGPLGDLPATGKSMESIFVTFFRIENNRIAEIWVEWDNLAMLTQLGHFPPPDINVSE
jgi:steroid delta-isomerase-like uncharacterized protein